jgi:hypothetical protein
LAIVVDNKFKLVSNEIFTSLTLSGIDWIKFTENKETVLKWLSSQIHPSVKFSSLRKLILNPPSPISENPDSYFVRLVEKCKKALNDIPMNILDESFYKGKELNQILLFFKNKGKIVPCQVGGLIFSN